MLEHSRARQAAKIGQQLQSGGITPEQANERLNEILQCTESDLPPMEDAAELISKPIDLPPDVIEGVLHRGAKMVLGGGSKTFKTWTLVDLAISVATGTAWLGNFPQSAGAFSISIWNCKARFSPTDSGPCARRTKSILNRAI